MMAVHDPRSRMGADLLLILALGILGWIVGCGLGESGSKPAPIDAAQAQKVQAYMANYRDQMVAENKAKAKARTAKAAGKTSP